jgi:antitoxin component YwqK of YwqJK toxin-antitoxin module
MFHINNSYAQYVIPKDSTISRSVIDGFCNENPCLKYYFFNNDTTKVMYSCEKKSIISLISYTNKECFSDFQFHKNGKIKFIIEVKKNKVNGRIFCFDKKGRIELILSFKDSIMNDVLYCKSDKNLLKYIEQFKYGPPINYIDLIR